MNILAVGAHFDDLELGCGGSILRWAKEGNSVTGLILTDSGFKDEQGNVVRKSKDALAEGKAAAKKAGYELITGPFKTFELSDSSDLNNYLLTQIKKIKPDLILTHWTHDTHPDHAQIARSTLHCAKHVPRLLMYRSNWYLSDQPFHPNFYVDISDEFKNKLKLVSIYKTEVSRSSGAWLSWLTASATESGHIAGCQYAEGFQTVKWLWARSTKSKT